MPEARRSRARDLDQFYTRPDVAASCVGLAQAYVRSRGLSPRLWIEPSAGSGAFLSNLPEPRLGIDLEPAAPGIEKGDFLDWRPDGPDEGIITIGNPPFGKNSSLALRFLNHAGGFSRAVCFVLPRTFEKCSMQRRVAPWLHLAEQHSLGQEAFEFEGLPYSVPCVFQIWERSDELRRIERQAMSHAHFEFTTPDRAEFSLQRVGARAGLISDEVLGKAPTSHYFIRQLAPQRDVRAALAGIDWTPIRSRTAGNPSISKTEVIAAYEESLRSNPGVRAGN